MGTSDGFGAPLAVFLLRSCPGSLRRPLARRSTQLQDQLVQPSSFLPYVGDHGRVGEAGQVQSQVVEGWFFAWPSLVPSTQIAEQSLGRLADSQSSQLLTLFRCHAVDSHGCAGATPGNWYLSPRKTKAGKRPACRQSLKMRSKSPAPNCCTSSTTTRSML